MTEKEIISISKKSKNPKFEKFGEIEIVNDIIQSFLNEVNDLISKK